MNSVVNWNIIIQITCTIIIIIHKTNFNDIHDYLKTHLSNIFTCYYNERV